ncbi:lysosomal thioesterase PPT2-like isoform X1 [Oryzias latipes]
MPPKKPQEYEDLKKSLDIIQEKLKSFMDQVSAKLTPLWDMMEEFRRFRAQNEQRENRVEILEKRLDDVEQQEHPSTKVTVIDLFNNMESIKPLWKQVHGVGKVIQRIMKKSPRGVHLLCFSQGGLICRGVLSVLPNHNVHAFIALASPLAGQYGVSQVMKSYYPSSAMDSVYFLCYNKFMQKRISLCNFWNDPHQQVKYLKHNNFLPLLNGRKPHSKMAEWRKNFLRIKKLVLIGGPDDDVIIPWQSRYLRSHLCISNIMNGRGLQRPVIFKQLARC